MTDEPLWTANDIAAVTGGRLIGDDFAVTGISIDTRTIQPGDLFIALKGPRMDGHDYADAALEKGAAGILVEKGMKPKSVIVADTFRALHDLGAGARERSHAHIIAVTGSVGKTSTKEMLAGVLKSFGKTHAAEASLNNHWGVPLSLARLPVDAEYAVFEIGMNHAGEIAPLSKLVSPQVAMITTIAAAHIQHLGSIENIAKAKAEIFQGMDANGIAVLPRDNDQFALLVAEARTQGLQKILSFGEHPESDIRLASIDQGSESSDVSFVYDGRQHTFALTIPGKHQAINALGVIAVLTAVGVDLEEALDGFSDLSPVKGRGNRFSVTVKEGKASIKVIDETHNASPIAVEAALKVLVHVPTPGRRIVILGDMLELGDESPELHKGLKKPLLEADPGLVLTCGPMMAHLAQTLPKDGSKHYPDSTALAADIGNILQSGDVVLVKGSRGSKMTLVIDAIKQMGQFEEPSP